MQSHVLAALVFERYVWYFGSLHPAFEMSCDTEYLKKQLLIFSETWSPSFCLVCNCFDEFRTNLPKKIGQFHRKQNTKFPKRRWVRSKKFFRELPQTSLLGTIRVFCSNAESSFGCARLRRLRLVLWLFTSCVWDVLWYDIEDFKNSSCFLSKTETFQNDVEDVPKMSFWALVGLLLWL